MTTLAQAQSMLAEYLAAESALLQGKQVRLSVNGIERFWTSEDLTEIRKGRAEWEGRVSQLQGSAAGAPTFGGLSFKVARFDGR